MVILLFWLICGYLAAGVACYSFRKEFSDMPGAPKDWAYPLPIIILSFVGGPVALIAWVILTVMDETFGFDYRIWKLK